MSKPNKLDTAFEIRARRELIYQHLPKPAARAIQNCPSMRSTAEDDSAHRSWIQAKAKRLFAPFRGAGFKTSGRTGHLPQHERPQVRASKMLDEHARRKWIQATCLRATTSSEFRDYHQAAKGTTTAFADCSD